MRNTIRRFLAPPVFPGDQDKTRRARLLNIILLTQGIVLLTLLAATVVSLLLGNRDSDLGVMATALLAVGLWQFLMRRGQVSLSSAGMIALFTFSITLVIALGGTIRSPGAAYYPLVVVLATLLIGRRAGIVAAILSSLIALGLVSAEINGLLPEPTNSVTLLSGIHLVASLSIATVLLNLAMQSIDEALERSRRGEREVRALNATLEQRVASRTRDLALAAEVGRSLSSVRDLDTLLREAVELVRARFDLYYTQIYITDPTGRALILRAGTGEVGVELIRRAHRLPVGPGSLNGAAAAQKQAVIVADTAASPEFRPNPLLPDTRSEMSVPLLVGGRVVGVLDLQSPRPGALTEDSLPAFEALAGQLAIAIQNANLFAEAERARAEVEAHARRLTHEGWADFLNAVERSERVGYVYDQGRLTPLAEPDSQPASLGLLNITIPISVMGELIGSLQLVAEPDHPWAAEDQELAATVARQAAQQLENLRLLAQAEQYQVEAQQAVRRLTRESWVEYLGEAQTRGQGYVYDLNQVLPLGDEADGANLALTQPLTVGGEVIGEFALAGDASLSEESAELVSAVAEKLSAHIENLRLFEQTQSAMVDTEDQARRLARLNGLGEELSRATTVEAILQAVADQASEIVHSDRSSVILLTETGDSYRTMALSGEIGLVSAGTLYPLAGTTAEMAVKQQRVAVVTDPDLDTLPRMRYFVEQGLRSFMNAPLISGGRVIGTLNVASVRPDAYGIRDEDLLSQTASLLASTLENRRLFEQTQTALAETQKRSQELVALNRIITLATSSFNLRTILQAASREIVQLIHARNTGIALLDPARQQLTVLADYSVSPDDPSAAGVVIPLEGNVSSLQVIETKRSLVVPRPQTNPLTTPIHALMRERNTQCLIITPLLARGEVVGTIGVDTTEVGREFTPGEVSLVETIAGQLAGAIENIRLFDEAERRANELATVAQVSTAASTLLEPVSLLQTVVDLAKSGFDLYHVHIYLLNETGAELVLAAGAGLVGQQMIAEGHRLPFDREHSLVARAARTHRGVIVNDVSREPGFLPHPLLPETRSELAVPLIAGGKVLGVFDVQSETPHRFTDEDVRIQTTLAAQIAVALQNAASYAEVVRARAQIEAQARRLTREGWEDFLNAVDHSERLGYVYDLTTVTPLAEPLALEPAHTTSTLTAPLVVTGEALGALRVEAEQGRQWDAEEAEIVSAVAQRLSQQVENLRLLDQAQRYRAETERAIRRLTREGWADYLTGADQTSAGYVYDQNQVLPVPPEPNGHDGVALSHPLNVHGEVIGQVALEGVGGPSEEQAELVALVSERLSAHIETLRLSEQTEAALAERVQAQDALLRQNEYLAALQQTSLNLLGRLELTDLLHNILARAGALLGTQHGYVFLVEPDETQMRMAVGVGTYQAFVGHGLKRGEAVVGSVWQTGEPLVIDDYQVWAKRLAIGGLENVHGVAAVPLKSGSHTVGVIGLAHTEAGRRFGEEEITVLTRFGQLASVALDNARLFSTAQQELAERKQAEAALARRAAELEIVAQVSAASSSVLEAEPLLQTVVDLTKQSFGLYHAHIYLLDESGEKLVLAAGAGEIGRQMMAQGWEIPLGQPTTTVALRLHKSVVAQAANTRKAVIVNDVQTAPGFLPHPLLPETRSEMTIPLIVGETLLGVFDVQSQTVNRFTDEDVRVYTTLAAQVAVALQNADLYAEQAATLNRLRELDQLKSAFLANMSHELRTPLNSILGFTEVILEELDGPLTSQMENDLKIVHKNGQHLLNLINDVLDMAKIESGKMVLHLERFDLTEVLEEVIGLTSPLARAKSLDLRLEADLQPGALELEADRIRIRQVVINLANNAIKFTDQGHITLRATRLAQHVRVVVQDTGLGIPADHLEVVFQEFTQVDTSTTRKAGGTGLGLPISRHLVEMHGGKLWAESAGIPGQGSAFIIELPVELAPPAESEA
jgi:GAF domain-containing protein